MLAEESPAEWDNAEEEKNAEGGGGHANPVESPKARPRFCDARKGLGSTEWNE
jgi:hypothetical protein